MKQFHLEVHENDEPRRGRKVYDQKIYVSALERGTRDRSPRPRRVEPLPDRIELKICPQKNHRGRLKYYRAPSIPELCRITLKPTGETSLQQGRMEEVYITQYTHAFDRQIEKPHIVAWKQAFEDCDVAHRDSKLCIVNSPVGSKPGGFPERRRSAPPGSFVFDYDALDMPQPVHRRSKSLGMFMNDPIDFDQMDIQMGESAGRKMDTLTVESAGGNVRPLAHERISAQKVEQVESVDSTFWDEDFGSFDGENYSTSRSKNDVRNNDVTTDGVMTDDVINDDVTTYDVMTDDVMSHQNANGDAMTGDVIPKGVSRNGFSIRYDDITHDRDSSDHSTQDPTKQARSLISTLRSTVKKPDSETFLRSIHAPQTSRNRPESASKNRPPLKNQSEEPTLDQEVSYRNKVSLGTFPRESPQKVTPRIVSNPSREFTYQTVRQHEVPSRNNLPKETTSRKTVPQEVLSLEVSTPRQFASEMSTISPEKAGSQPKEKPGTNTTYSSRPNLGISEMNRKYQSEPNPELNTSPDKDKLLPEFNVSYTHSKPEVSTINDWQPMSGNSSIINDPSIVKDPSILDDLSVTNHQSISNGPSMTKDPSTIIQSIAEDPSTTNHRSMTNESSVIKGPSITNDPSITKDPSFANHRSISAHPSIANHSSITNHQKHELESNDKATLFQRKTDGHPEQVKPTQNVHPKKQTQSELRDTSDEDYENVVVRKSHKVHQTQSDTKFIANATPERVTPEHEKDDNQQPKPELNTMETATTSHSIQPKHVQKEVNNHQPKSAEIKFSEGVTLDHDVNYYQQPRSELNTMETATTSHFIQPKHVQNELTNHQPKSGKNKLSEQVTSGQDEGYHQEPSFDIRTTKTVERNQGSHPNQFDNTVYNRQPKSTKDIISEQVTRDRDGGYYQQPDPEVKSLKTVETNQSVHPKQDKNTVSNRNSKSPSNITPEIKTASQSQNEDYYQQPSFEVRTLKTDETDQSSHPNKVKDTVYNRNSKSPSNMTPEVQSPYQNEDYYQQPRMEALETNQNSHPKQDKNAVYNRNSKSSLNMTPEVLTPNQNEDYYQQPNPEARTKKTVETNQSIHPEQDKNAVYNRNSESTSNVTPEQIAPGHGQNEDYYQQPNIEVRKVETLQNILPKQGKNTFHSNHSKSTYITSEQLTPQQDEQYYQQPKFEVKIETTPLHSTELKPNESLYEEPKVDRDSNFSATKCPLDQIDMQRNGTDYKKPLPDTPTELKTSESYYEVPTETNISSKKCPLDEKDAERNDSTDYYEQPVEHIYEQPNFVGERLYEQFDYEKMTPPNSSELVELIYEKPDSVRDTNVCENFGVDKRHLHSKVGYKVVKTSQLKDKADVVYQQPKTKAELSSTLQQGNLKRSEFPVPETFRTDQFEIDHAKQNKNIESTTFSISSTKTPENSTSRKESIKDDSLTAEVKYPENAGSKYKQADKKYRSSSSLTPHKDLNENFNGQSTRVRYSGEISSKKSVVSTASSVRIDQSDGRISDDSPKRNSSRTASSEEELLPQKPEAEVLNGTLEGRVKAKKTQDEEFSQPSVYSKTSYSKANSGNTSLARFSSFNSEASYKRSLTSAWIEQQRTNFKKAVSREPSLRRTKSVEFHKQRRPSDETTDYKLKHSKSELSFEQLNAMYDPFDDKYLDTNPNRHPAKVVHAPASEVIKKAKSIEHRVKKVEDVKNLSEVNTPTSTIGDSSPVIPLEKDTKHRYTQQDLSMGENMQRQESMFTNNGVKQRNESNNRPGDRPKSADVSGFDVSNDEVQNLSMVENWQRQDKMLPNSEVKQRKESSNASQRSTRVGPKSADISGFDITVYNDESKNLSMGESLPKQDIMLRNEVRPNSSQRLRPKSADVSGFDITSYYDEPKKLPTEDLQRQDKMSTNVVKPSSTQRSRARPKSADVSGFDITRYGGEPTLKHSKSELSVDQLKAMYAPYDQNSWFSPDPVSQSLNQSDSRRQVDATVHEVLHRSTSSELESRPDRYKNGGKMKQPEEEIRKGEIRNLEAEPIKNITKLNNSSVLLLNVVEVGPNSDPMSPKFKRNAASKSTSNIVSVTASEIENDKQLTMRESTRNVKQNKMGEPTVAVNAAETRDTSQQNEEPVEKLRARYIVGGERASVRYLSKSTDELTSSANNTVKKEETITQPQGQPSEKPVKAPKKDGGFRNFFGRIRKSKSEPNLDKNFSVLDIDCDHGGKKKNSQKLNEKEKSFQETSPGNSQEKLQNSSKSGLKASSFYPKFKNFKKNFSKSKHNKADGNFNDSSVDSGQDMSKSKEFLERSISSESDIKRETVQQTECAGDVVPPENIETNSIDSPVSSKSTNPANSRESYTNSSERPKNLVQLELFPNSGGKETKPTSPSSPITSPSSTRKRFFQGGNRITPVTVVHNENALNAMFTSQGNGGDEDRKTTDKVLESDKRTRMDTDIFVHTASPVTTTANDKFDVHDLSDQSESLDSKRIKYTTTSAAHARFQADSKLQEDKVRFSTTSEESRHLTVEPQERTTSYRITEVPSSTSKSSKREIVSDQNNSRFVSGSTSGEVLKLPTKATAYITKQSSSSTLSTTSNAYNAKQSLSSQDNGNTDPGLDSQFNDMEEEKISTTYNTSTSYITVKSNSEENLSLNTQLKGNDVQNRQRYSLHEDSTLLRDADQTKNEDIGFNNFKAGHQNDSYNQQRNSFHEDLKVISNDDNEIESKTVESNQGRDSRNNGLDSKHEEINTKDSKEPEIASPKTKHRTFFGTKFFTSAGRSNSSQGKNNPERKEGKENELVRKKENTASVNSSQDPIMIEDNVSKSKNNKESVKANEMLNMEEEGNISQTSKRKENKGKNEFGSRIKGFITKVLPQKDKNVTKEEVGNVETGSEETKVNELERSSDENNNTTTTVSVTAISKDESKDSDQGANSASNTTTKSRRTTFVAKHLGESDSEKTRSSEDERKQVKSGTIEVVSSNPNKNERRTSYTSKVKHMGDSNTVRKESLEKITNFDGKSFATLATEKNEVGKMNASGSLTSRDIFETKGLQDETIAKTEVVNNVEAFDSVFDFFEKALNDQESEDDKDFSRKESSESNATISSSTMYPEMNADAAQETEYKVDRHQTQLKGRGERVHVSTTEVNMNKSDANKNFKEIAPNMQTERTRDDAEYSTYVKETLDSESSRSLEQIKGFTIKHKKTSSFVLNKSMEDSLDSLGKDDVNAGEVQENLRGQELNTKQANASNSKTEVAKGTILVSDETEQNRSSQEDQNTTENETKRGTTAFLVKHEDIDKEQQLKYAEKVMVSVHRGASDVKKLVRESTETTAESSDLSSLPVSKYLEHVRSSSGEDNGKNSPKLVPSHEKSAEEASLVRSNRRTNFRNGMSSDQSSFPVSKSLEYVRSSSGEDNGKKSSKLVLTHEVPANEARLVPSSPEKDFGNSITKQERRQERALNVDEDWGHVIDEFVIKNKAETTNTVNKESNNINDSGDELLQLIEEQIGLENSPKNLQPEDSSTPIQDDKTGKHKKSIHEDSPSILNSPLNSAVGSTLVHSTSTSSEMVDKTDGARFENKRIGTSNNATATTGQLMSTSQSPTFTSNSLVKTTEKKSSQPASNAATVSYTRNQTSRFSSNFQEQRTDGSTRSVTSLEQQNEAVVGRKLTRPKSLLNRDTKNIKTTVSMSQKNNQFKETTDLKDATISKTEVIGTNFVSNQKGKQKPPPVLPKPKRNKSGNGTKDTVPNGNAISQVKVGGARQKESQQRKSVGFMDVQNSNLSFVNFQSFQESYNGSTVKDEQNKLYSTQNYNGSGISRESFASGRHYATQATQNRQASRSVTVKQFKKKGMETSETFKRFKKEENASDTMKQIENKETTSISSPVKQRKKRGTTASETSEDLSVRLQRLLCDDESMSEPDDSSVAHEVSSAIYSFSEDSEFDTNLVKRRYKRPRKTPATLKIPRSSYIPMDESSDEEVFEHKTMAFDYRMHSKTL